jgi:hypothetical protein
MATLNFFPTTNGVKIRRTNITTNGLTADIDSHVREQLAYLDELLGAPIYIKVGGDFQTIDDISIREIVQLPLKARMYGNSHRKEQQWQDDSLLNVIYRTVNNPKNEKIYNIEEYIDAEDKLSLLKFEFKDRLTGNWNNLDLNTRSILSYPNIINYLLAFGYNSGYTEINGLTNFIFGNKYGNRNVIIYTQISASRQYINEERVSVEYNNEKNPVITDILKGNPSFSSVSFSAFVTKTLENYVDNSSELEILKDSKYYPAIPPAMIPKLIQQIKASILPVNDSNIDILLPIFMNEIENTPGWEDDTTTDGQNTPDYSVSFLDDDAATVQVISDNIRCAAQMFYSMTLGEELDIFSVVNFFTHKFMVRGNIQISDPQLREDLQMYVFSNKFTHPKTGKIIERTRPAERRMFYKQVFNYGNAPVTDDVVVNREFPKYWRILIMEVARYIQRAQDSPNPESYVSRQTVMQAVEDLQYNLSTHCSGMANVISPIIYDELYFVIKRILNHPEIVKQLVPAGGNWWKVVEMLYEGMKHQRPKTTIHYNKAKLGYEILNSIAAYNPTTFEDDKRFSTFISNVDAFIISQAQLQQKEEDDNEDDREHRQKEHRYRDRSAEKEDDEETPEKMPPSSGSKDEWDF